uniref:TAFA chemokine like family member 5 n=1 Tax=Takifugu rubripes TaxID=31033 RepID=A0A674MH05_TAKRU
MAPVSRRKDAGRWPRMSSTFWAVVLLTALLLLYCGQLAAGTCEIVTLDRDSSQPRRTIARQTARCACKKGQIAGTTRTRPACVDGVVTQLQVGGAGDARPVDAGHATCCKPPFPATSAGSVTASSR